MFNYVYSEIVADRASWLWGSLDFLPPNISVNSTVRGEPRMGDFVGGVRLEKYCYSLVHLTDYELTLWPHAFAEQVIGRQLKKVKKDIADHLWSQFDLDHQYEVVFTPPRRVKDAVVLQGDIPLRWMVVEEMGEFRSTVDVYMGMRATVSLRG